MSICSISSLVEIALNEYNPVHINIALAIVIRTSYNNNVIIIIIIITVIVIVTLLNFRNQSNIFDNIYTNVPSN